jgi:hypothetical protein
MNKAIITNESKYQDDLNYVTTPRDKWIDATLYRIHKSNLQALVDKSIPMEIIDKGFHAECPKCNGIIEKELFTETGVIVKVNSCPICGQKLRSDE